MRKATIASPVSSSSSARNSSRCRWRSAPSASSSSVPCVWMRAAPRVVSAPGPALYHLGIGSFDLRVLRAFRSSVLCAGVRMVPSTWLAPLSLFSSSVFLGSALPSIALSPYGEQGRSCVSGSSGRL